MRIGEAAEPRGLRVRRQVGELAAPIARSLRRMKQPCRRLLLRTRLGQWVYVIHRLRSEYRRFSGRTPALFRPRRFSEKMQWRKLFELDPRFALMVDKLAARDFVAARIGPGRRPELLWVGTDPAAIPFDQLVPPYVLKSSHGSGHVIIVRDRAALDVAAARAMAGAWLAHCHGTATNEPAYIHVPRRLLVERLLRSRDGSTPLEHKVFVFNGRAAFIRTETPGEPGHSRYHDFHAPDWTPLPIAWGSPPHPATLSRPAQLAEIITLAEHVGAGLSHCRVDIFACDDTLMMGEVTIYTRSGMIPYTDPDHDLVMGAPWAIRWPMLRALWSIAVRRWEIRPPRG